MCADAGAQVDANSDGTVDWDEFTNFLLFEQQAFNNMEPFLVFPSRPVVAAETAPVRFKLSGIPSSPTHADASSGADKAAGRSGGAAAMVSAAAARINKRRKAQAAPPVRYCTSHSAA